MRKEIARVPIQFFNSETKEHAKEKEEKIWKNSKSCLVYSSVLVVDLYPHYKREKQIILCGIVTLQDKRS